MTEPTKAYITIEIEVPVSGNWRRAEPYIGINEGWFEDAQIDPHWWIPVSPQKPFDEQYAEQIQEALTEALQDDKDRADDRRDEAADAKAHYDRENQ